MFFKNLLKALAAALGAAAVIVAQHLIAFFQGAAPSDVSALVWGGISFVAILVLNFVIGKLPAPQP
jgi:hypothetical protein